MALNVTFIKATEAVSANYPLTPAGLQSVQATEADNDNDSDNDNGEGGNE